ncbi:efflux RND transporter periplasmic adaptor subunit [Aquabacterium sp.]|uniref:efflux RND transporter periplasmic adaptor subunit n=1 Tax=Aquabacterium sp. TaxID=1872578 RepID=UPI002C8EA812|nr:efflux RND transporter periplasmic adaptor subunit [Aquabacterium sp.]HSW07688.1 efflux RND transporter periplasmic adaptor subunit [Aquabacterium sp.]
MKKVHTTMVVLALAGAALAAWWLQNRPAASGAGSVNAAASAAASRGPAGAGGPVAVEVGRAERVRLEDDALAVGSLRSNQGVMLRPEVSGRILKLGFADGQRVKRGQPLVQLDDALQHAQLLQAQAQASIARTNLQRNRELVAQNFVSQSVVDQAQATLEVAAAQVTLAQAQLQRMKVTAPFDGIVGIRNVNIGDYVKDGADLVQVEDVSSVWVDFRLPERNLAQLKPGQVVSVNLDALPGKAYTARVEAVDSQLDASGRSLLVRAKLANTAGDLRSGMFARARIVFAVREAAIMVPEEALVPLGNQQYLIKVVDGPNNSKQSERIEARIGARRAGRVEILEGLQAGDVLVIAGQTRLMRGGPQPLRVVQLGDKAGAKSADRPASAAVMKSAAAASAVKTGLNGTP